jgi:hypothetical protein
MNLIKLFIPFLLFVSCNGIFRKSLPKSTKYFYEDKGVSEIPKSLKGGIYYGRPYTRSLGSSTTDLVMSFSYDSVIYTGYYGGNISDSTYPTSMINFIKSHKENQKSYCLLDTDSGYKVSILGDEGSRYHFTIYKMKLLNEDSFELEFIETKGLKKKYIKTDTLFLAKKIIMKRYYYK